MAKYMPLQRGTPPLDNSDAFDDEDVFRVDTPLHSHVSGGQQFHPLSAPLSRSIGLSSSVSCSSKVSAATSSALSPLPSQRVARDVMLCILSYLSRREVARCMMISTRWREVIHSDASLVEGMYTTTDDGEWSSIGTPSMSLPEDLLKWLSVSEWFRRPLPSQRALLAPLVLGCGGIIQCAPLAGISTAAVIASIWKAITSRLPQHLVIYCHRSSTSSTASSVKRVIGNIPVVATAANKLRITRNEPEERMGLKFNEGSLVLKSVNAKRIAHFCGAGEFVGKRLTHVNDLKVTSLAEVARTAALHSTVTLRFEGRGVADRVFWDDSSYLGGGSVQGVPFSLAISPYDNPQTVTPLEDTISFLTLRFSEKQPQTTKEQYMEEALSERGGDGGGAHRCSWAFCFLARKFRGRCFRKDHCTRKVKLDSDDDDQYHEVTIKRTPSERLGIKFEDGTLVLKSVNPSLKAHSHGVSKLTGRSLTHVNGVEVSTLEEVKKMVRMRTTFVTMEQGDCPTSVPQLEKNTTHSDPPPTTLITSPLDGGDILYEEDTHRFDSLFARPTPITIRMEGSQAARHHYVVLRDIHRDAGEIGAHADANVRRSSMLRQQIDLLEEILCEMMVTSLLIVCETTAMCDVVAERVGGTVLCRENEGRYNAANNWMEENVLVVPWDCVALAPRVSLVVVFAREGRVEGENAFGPWFANSLHLSGAQPSHPEISGASLTFVTAASQVDPLRTQSFSPAHAGLLELRHHQVVSVLRPLIESKSVSDLSKRVLA